MFTRISPSFSAAQSSCPPLAPVLKGYPAVGVLPQLLWDPLRFVSRAAGEHNGIVRLNLGVTEVYLVANADYAQHILRERAANYTKAGGMYDAVRLLAGNGLGVMDGDEWLRQRRMMQPMFSRQRLNCLPSLITTAAREAIAPWDSAAATQESFIIGPALAHITIRVVLKAIFSSSIDDGTIKALKDAIDVVYLFIGTRLWTYFLPDWFPVPGRGRFQEALRLVHHIIQSIIDERRRSPVATEDLLTLLLDARDEATGGAMSDEQLRYEVIGFLVAGFETSATALTWTLYLLGQNLDAQCKLREELDKTLAGRTPGLQDLSQLSYTRMVYQESMRLYPPGWVIPRRAIQEDVLGKYRIPAGATVAMLFYSIHRDPAHWVDPEAFKPERFADGTAARSLAYLPFGVGARQCIGSHFALMEGMLILALLLQRFRMKLCPEHPVEAQGSLALKPRHGVRVILNHNSATA